LRFALERANRFPWQGASFVQLRDERMIILSKSSGRVGKREVARAGTDFSARDVHLYLKFVETPVPFHTGGIVAERVGGARVIHGMAYSTRNVVRTVERLASRALSEQAHGIQCLWCPASRQAGVCIVGVSAMCVEVVLICTHGRAEQSSCIYRINRNICVGKGTCRSLKVGSEIFTRVVHPIEIKLVVPKTDRKARGDPHQVLSAFRVPR
jgi:hypothetical protein